MQKELIKIIELENSNDFELAFLEYDNLYNQNKSDFEIWKYFYFFLWIIIENMPNDFVEKIKREERLKEMFSDGNSKFSNNPEFNFIVGYTMSIFPYEFGDFDEYEKKAEELLEKARNLDPINPIYKMVCLSSSIDDNSEEYLLASAEAAQIVKEKYNGIGLYNDYFIQVLYRI
ncbi:MAG: hypothetical protein O9282_10110 [Flavobacterium sp.]|jgi:hypothetical protein|uniref:hypothetical protein n=1 Tax=Flavobacterium TaxID=237 RepID=UPI0022C2C425|nr:hypothetical protein [Flavobacterium sp.]MCZ8331654.1 hypothetical protein [Flavobacterium sp.]